MKTIAKIYCRIGEIIMSTNISKEKREGRIEKIKAIKTYISSAPQDQNTTQLLLFIADLEKVIKGNKYGLLFEEHEEAIDQILNTHTPVLTEEDERFVNNGGPINFLIEGDNLASLQLLEKTHKGKVEFIYIDPPYNRGKQDFVYDDVYIDTNDTFRHSKWLSFIEKRLKIAKRLLAPNGVIFISIDDNEQAQLKILCDNIFGEDNFINNFMWLHGKGKKDTWSRTMQQYILAYASNKKALHEWNDQAYTNYEFSNPDNDPKGKWFSGSLSFSENRSNPLHPNYYRITSPSGKVWERQWQVTKEEMKQLIAQNDIFWGYPPQYDSVPRQKIRPGVIDIIPSNILDDCGTTRGAIEELKSILGGDFFDYPKPTDLIIKLLKYYNKTNITVIDFFAGSGTTGHSVMKLNNQDGGNRKFILCTNNENNICQEVTYERIKRVIDRENYKASLKYFKVDFVPISDRLYYEYADELLLHIRELVELENGINFKGNLDIAIILTENELDNFTSSLSEITNCKTLYLGHDILPNAEQEKLFRQYEISVKIIPDYYYRDLEN